MLERLQAALAATYRIERELAGGGMSRLFLGTDVALGRAVVVKVLPPDIASEFSASRFRREIELAAHLQHPNILPILTAGSTGDLLYYVMPFVSGESLRHRLAREGRLPVDNVVQILSEVADALGYAHRQGIVHRDVKPENILLEEGHAVLTDFGVARALAASLPGERLTASGISLGTPGYMAPEQSAGDPNLDARADLYALGVVGYEMLTGSAPFTGPSAQAVLAAHLTAAPPSPRDSRPEVPRHVAEAIAKSLAKDPDDRFVSAAAFNQALRGAVPARRSVRTVGGMAVAGVVGLALLVLLGVRLFSRDDQTAALSPNVVAIAPFDVLAPELTLWREGLLDIVARNLDGAGPIRTVAPTVVIRRFRGRADAASARELGRRTGAGVAIYGALTKSGADSVRLSATLLDVDGDRQLGSIEIRDDADHIDRVADSASVALLRALGETRAIGATRRVSLGSRSLPALRAFLHGEQLYRRGVMDSARVAYERAVELDPAFGLALNRFGATLGWITSSNDSLALHARLRAGALAGDVNARDSLLLPADSNYAAASFAPSDTMTWHFARRAFALLATATQRFPDDPQLWYNLGEAKLHLSRYAPTPAGELLAAFERAIGFDSLFAPAYIHAVELAVAVGDTAKARRLANPYLTLSHHNKESVHIGAMAAWLDSPAGTLDTITLTASDAHQLSQALGYWPDSSEVGTRVARVYVRGATAENAGVAHARLHLASAFAFRGHLREAADVGIPNRTFVAELAVLGGYPPDSIGRVFARWLNDSLPVAHFALGWWGAQRDTTSLRTYITRAESRLRTLPASSLAAALSRQNLNTANLFLANTRGDTAAAFRTTDQFADSLCLDACDLVRLLVGRFRAAQGRFEQALRILTPPHRTVVAPLTSLFALERGRVAERMANPALAAKEYGDVVDLWRRPDPPLAPLVAEARAALERLGPVSDAPSRREVSPNPPKRP